MITIAIDIETIVDDGMPQELRDRFLREAEMESEIKVPKTYTKPESIAKYIEDQKLATLEQIEAKKKEIIREFCLSPLTGRIATIGVYGEYVDNSTGVGTEIRKAFTNKDEAVLLIEFWDYIGKLAKRRDKLKIITYNGQSFDIPYLKVRSALKGVTPAYRIDNRKFYTENHLDVRQALTNFGQSFKKGRLNDWAMAFGLPTKLSEGSHVQEMWDEGKIDELEGYCIQDCIITYRLGLIIQNIVV